MICPAFGTSTLDAPRRSLMRVTSAIAGALCSVVYSICPIIVLWAFARFPVLVVCGMFSPFCLSAYMKNFC